MKSKILFGGMATATAVVLAVVTYRTMPIAPQDVAIPSTSSPVSKTDRPDDPARVMGQDKKAKIEELKSEDAPAKRPAEQRTTPKNDTPSPEREAGLRERDERKAVPQAAMHDRAPTPAPAPPASAVAGALVEPNAATPSAVGKALNAAPSTNEQASQVGRQMSDAIKRKSVTGQHAPQSLRAPGGYVGTQPTDQPSPNQFDAVGRDQFATVDENPVKRVALDPISTFSVDVDTASYAFVRRMLMRGALPQKNAVRVEELINYFDYDYPLPATREQPFRPTVTVMPSPWKAGNKLIQIGVKGYDLKAAEKPRSNLVFLLDVSGSMNAPDKLPLMINSMKLLLDTLRPNDTVAIVVYAGAAGTVLEPTLVSEKQKILASLEHLRAGGSTAGAAGIRQAYALAEGNFDKEAVNRVILATDGDFNVGITNREELKGFIERKRKSGVFLSVLGFGQGNLNDRLMQDLAQNGNGVAAHIDTLNEARKVLVDEASGMLFPIAKDVKIQVEFNPKTVSEYRLIGYETRALKREDFKNDKVDAGDIGAGHTVTAIYEITPVGTGNPLIDNRRYRDGAGAAKPSASATSADEYAFLKIRYKLPDETVSKLITTPITASQETDGGSDTLSREAQWAAAVAAFGQILKGGKYTGAYSYDDVTALARVAKGDDPFGYRAEFISLVRLARSASALPRR